MLANVVGAGRARVQVSAELDLNRSTVTSETFDPDSQVVRSTQTARRSQHLRPAPTARSASPTNCPAPSPEHRRRAAPPNRARPPKKSPTTRSPRPPRPRSPKPAASSACRSPWWSMASIPTTPPATSAYAPRDRGRNRPDPDPGPLRRRLFAKPAATRSKSSTCSSPSGPTPTPRAPTPMPASSTSPATT